MKTDTFHPEHPEAEDDKPHEEKQPLLGRVSRRSFLSHLGAAGLAATTQPLLATTSAPATTEPAAEEPPAVPGAVPVTLRVNGQDHRLMIEPRVTLPTCLRENLHLSGTRKASTNAPAVASTSPVNGPRVNPC